MSTMDTAEHTPAPSPGLTNLRDLGGLPTADGRSTVTGVLYRSDVPLAGDADPTGGLVWPPRTVIDLRSAEEQAKASNPFRSAQLHLLPLMSSANPEAIGRPSTDTGGFDGFFTRLYQTMLRSSGHLLGRLPGIMASAPGPVLVHCTAGRDRTGVSVAVLLRAAGVTPQAVLADYVATAANQSALFPRLAAGGLLSGGGVRAQLQEEFGDTAVAMEAVLETLESHPGGARGYLVAHGASETDIDAWGRRILGG